MCCGFVYKLCRLTFYLISNRPMDQLHMKCFYHHLRSTVPGSIIHYNNLIQFVIQRQKGFYSIHDRNFLIIGRDDDDNRDIVILQQYVLHPYLLLFAIKSRGTDCHGKKQKSRIPDQVDDKKYTYSVQKCLDGLHQSVCHASTASFSFALRLSKR